MGAGVLKGLQKHTIHKLTYMRPTDTLLDTRGGNKIIKMCDFGFSKHNFFQSPCASLVGTLVYMAPEIINSNGNTPYDGQVCLNWNCLTRYAAHAFVDAITYEHAIATCRLPMCGQVA
jgi:serine/threonine protein kinase